MATRRQELEMEQGSEAQGQALGQASQLALRPPHRKGPMTPGRELGSPQEGSAWQRSGLPGMDEERLAQFLGWFSIGLGLAEVVSPGGLARLIGVRGDHRLLIRAFGLREIASGIGILTQQRPAGAVWSRVVGDALDLACLGAAFASPTAKRDKLVMATAAVAGVTLLDVLCSQQLSARPGADTGSDAIRVRQSVIVNRSATELYQFWRNFQNLPQFMKHLESVQLTGDGRSHWVAKAPAGTTVEWDAELTEDRPNELIAWRSLEGADVDNSGSVRFASAPGGRGTVVRVEFEYNPPGGMLGATLAKLFGEEPEQQVEADLRRFKQVLETGEVVLSDATLHGTGVTVQRPAQPTGR